MLHDIGSCMMSRRQSFPADGLHAICVRGAGGGINKMSNILSSSRVLLISAFPDASHRWQKEPNHVFNGPEMQD